MELPPQVQTKSAYKQDKRDRRMQEVLAAAAHTFRLRGYEAATMQDIASRLGVRSAALYHYAPSKERLLEEICETVGSHYNRSLTEILNSGTSAPEMVRRAIAMHLHPDWYNHAGAFAFSRGNLSEEARHRLGVMAKQNLQLWTQMMRRGIREGTLRHDLDCELAAASVLAMCNGIIGMLEGMSPGDITAMCEKLTSYCVTGMQAVSETHGAAKPPPLRLARKSAGRAVTK